MVDIHDADGGEGNGGGDRTQLADAGDGSSPRGSVGPAVAWPVLVLPMRLIEYLGRLGKQLLGFAVVLGRTAALDLLIDEVDVHSAHGTCEHKLLRGHMPLHSSQRWPRDSSHRPIDADA